MAATSGEDHIVPAARRPRTFAALLVVAIFAACDVRLTAIPAASTTAAIAAASGFDAAAAHRHLEYLADPARQGRLTGSAGYAESARYVADGFRDAGLEPAGDDGTFLQHFPLAVPHLTADPVLATSDGAAFRLRTDFAELVGGLRGGGDVEAPVVYVGGAVDTATYSDFTGVDVRGKVALVSGPTDEDPAANAIRHGAAAILLVARDNPGPFVHYSFLSEISLNAVPTLVVSQPTAERLVATSGKRIAELRAQLEAERNAPDRRPHSFETGVRVHVSVPLAARAELDAINVVGVLRPAAGVADKYVVIGGHLDGVGTDPDGTVYPAANDNASGPAVTIEVARALVARRAGLRYGVIFVAWAGEEEGLRGSAEFLRRGAGTPFAADRIAAYINLDVVGCCGERLAASHDDEGLFRALSDAARKRGLSLGTTGGSSDHETFVHAGVPAAIVLWAQIGAIHTASDTVATVDAGHLATVGSFVVQAVLDLAVR